MSATIRNTFPNEYDMRFIKMFLCDGKLPKNEAFFPYESDLSQDAQGVRFNGVLILWFDGSNQLIGRVPRGQPTIPSMRAINAALDMLGISARLTREQKIEAAGTTIFDVVIHYYFDGSEFNLDDPIVLCGPLTVEVYRAQTNQTP